MGRGEVPNIDGVGRGMKILFMAGNRISYTRNSVICRGLQENGVEVVQCATEGGNYPTRFAGTLYNYIKKKTDDVDAIYIGFLGHPLVPLIRRITDKPLIFDAFISVYDTLCTDRKKVRDGSLAAHALKTLDRVACSDSDIVLLDTEHHRRFFIDTFGVPEDKVFTVPVGADNRVFYPSEERTKKSGFDVFYYCSYLPLHGADIVIKAAQKLERERDIRFLIAGKGPEKKKALSILKDSPLDNVHMMDWIPYPRLHEYIGNADVCLGGHFSYNEKGMRVIAGKTYQFMAMNKPTIIGKNFASYEYFDDGVDCLMTEHGDPASLADAITRLVDDPGLKHKIADNSYRKYTSEFTPPIIGRKVLSCIDRVV